MIWVLVFIHIKVCYHFIIYLVVDFSSVVVVFMAERCSLSVGMQLLSRRQQKRLKGEGEETKLSYSEYFRFQHDDDDDDELIF